MKVWESLSLRVCVCVCVEWMRSCYNTQYELNPSFLCLPAILQQYRSGEAQKSKFPLIAAALQD